MVDVVVQTEDSAISERRNEMSAQTEDNVTRNEVSVPTETLEDGRKAVEKECDSEEDDSYSLCEGNNDEKFIPLVIKHKGISKDALR